MTTAHQLTRRCKTDYHLIILSRINTDYDDNHYWKREKDVIKTVDFQERDSIRTISAVLVTIINLNIRHSTQVLNKYAQRSMAALSFSSE